MTTHEDPQLNLHVSKSFKPHQSSTNTLIQGNDPVVHKLEDALASFICIVMQFSLPGPPRFLSSLGGKMLKLELKRALQAIEFFFKYYIIITFHVFI